MIPATHAAVGGLVARRVRNLGVALALSFGLHYVLDGIYHFESFYELSVPGLWTYERTRATLFAALAPLAAPFMIWLWMKSRPVWWFACYAFLLSLAGFEPTPGWRLLWALLLSAGWMLATPTAAARRWVLGGFAAYLPDCLKGVIPGLGWLHDALHYRSGLDLGDWLSLLVRGRWRVPLNSRAYDPYYLAGYAVEILIEAAILCGCLYWLTKPSVTDLAAVDDKRGAVDERSLVGE